MQLLSRRELPLVACGTLVLTLLVAFRINGSAVDPQMDIFAPLAEQQVPAHSSIGYQSRIALHFDAQGRDAEWSRKAESALRATLGSHESGEVELRGVDCRTTICRMEFEHDGSRATASMIDAITGMLPEVVAEPAETANGRQSVVMYISREGLR